MDGRSGKVGGSKLEEPGLRNEPTAFAILGQFDRHKGIAFHGGKAIEARKAVIRHDVIRVDKMFHTQVLLQ